MLQFLYSCSMHLPFASLQCLGGGVQIVGCDASILPNVLCETESDLWLSHPFYAVLYSLWMIPMTTSGTAFAVLELLLLKASCLLVRSAKQIHLLLFSFTAYRTKLKLDCHNRNKLKKRKRRGWVEQHSSIVQLGMLYLVIVTSWNITFPGSVRNEMFHVKVAT